MAVSGFHVPPGSTPPNGIREMYYVKGSIDNILDRCKSYYVSEDSAPNLDASTRKSIMDTAQATASRGLRVLAMAYGFGSAFDNTIDSSMREKKISAPSAPASRAASPFTEKSGLIFVGFQAMLDPPRRGVADSIGLLQSGGVQVVMITGDSEQTALAIARDLGLRVAGGRRSGTQYPPSVSGGAGVGIGGGCLTGQMIDRMTKAQLKEAVGGVSVFARTTPRHKMAIVEAFQSRGAVVAMTGDGGTRLLFLLHVME
jgi:P-type Ca2+ transporter type 2C